MRIQEETAGDIRILRLAGELDVPEAREVAERLDRAGSRLVLNLSGVNFASAAALGSLVRASARAREGEGELVLSAPSRFVRTIVRQVGLDRLLRVFPDDESALRHLCPPRTAAGGCTQGGLHVAVS